MEFLRQRLAQVRTSWDQLSASGRWALTLAVLLVVALLVIVSHHAGSPDMVPLPMRFEPEELGRAANALSASGIKAEAREGQIFVPSNKQTDALGMLAYSDAMPESGIDFDKVIDSASMWESEGERLRRWRLAQRKYLEQSLASLPGVKRVALNINYGSTRTIRAIPEGVSASISVETSQASPLTKRLARAMANLVAPSVHGLSIDNVKVVDVTSGRYFDVSDGAALHGEDYVQRLGEYSSYFERKLLDHFRSIAGMKVTVNVVPTIQSSTTREHSPDPRAVIEGGVRTSSSSSTGGAAAGDVGVIPNAGPGPASAARAAMDSEDEEEIKPPIDWGMKDVETTVPPGAIEKITVAINLPHSYLVKVAQADASAAGAEGGADAPVNQDAITKVFDVEKLKIAKQAAKVIGAEDASAVDVDWQYDFEPTMAAFEAGSSGAGGLMAAAKGYGPPVVMGLLAALALLMVYNVVRKIQPASMPAESGSAEPVSEAGLTLDSILEGVELEADVIRASKMQEQISNMIKEDPDSVASLVKRWVSQE